jgi:hypothetical protein
LRIFRKSVEKIQVLLKADNNKGYFTWRPIYIFIISLSCFLRMRKFSDKRRENQNTHFVFVTFFLNRSVYEIMWKNVVQPDRSQIHNTAHELCMLHT